jgi:hypothetical protein
MALTPQQIGTLVSMGALSKETGATLLAQQQQPQMRFDPSRTLGTGDQSPMGAPPAPPSTPGSLGTGAGLALAQQLMGNVRAQAGAPETISAPVAALARPSAQPAIPAPQGAPATGVGAPKGPTPVSLQKDYHTAMLGNLDDQTRNVENQRDFEITQAQLQAAEIQKQNEALEASDAQRQAEHAHRSQAAEAALSDLNSRSSELGQFKEDPNRLWHNMSAGRQVLAGVGLLMSAIGGQQGQAIQVLQTGIDRDIAAQRSEWQAKKDSVAARHSAFGQMMRLYNDEDSASAALRTLQLDAAARKLQLMTAGSQSAAVQLKADQALSAIKAQRDQAAYQFGIQQYALAHPAGGNSGDKWFAANTAFPTQEMAVKGYAEWKAKNPDGTWQQFIQSSQRAGGGAGGSISPRLAGAVVKEGQVQATSDRLAKDYGLEKGSPGWIEAKAQQLSNWVGDAFGTEASKQRTVDRTMMAGELAAVATGGAPDEKTVAEYRHLLDTNNPQAIQAVIDRARQSGLALRRGVQEVSRRGVTQESGFADDGGYR